MSIFDVLCNFILSQLEAVMHVHASVLTTFYHFLLSGHMTALNDV